MNRYKVVETEDGTEMYAVLDVQTREFISDHVTKSEAEAAIRRYEDADRRRAS
jgi:hypothetical protein